MRKIIGITLLSLSAAASYASDKFPQHIEVCLAVYNDSMGSPLQAGYVSSDVLDSGDNTGSVRSGTQTCVYHTYQYGPKNIRLDVQATEVGSLNDTIFYPDSSCFYMKRKTNSWMRSDYLRAKLRHEMWNFTLTQMPPRNGYRYVYNLACQHVAY